MEMERESIHSAPSDHSFDLDLWKKIMQNQPLKIICLSATPMEESPMEIIDILTLIDPSETIKKS